MKGSSLISRSDSLICPFCETGELLWSSAHDSMRCQSCDGLISGALLETLRQISALPDVLGTHACEECAHPQMRLLPDGTYHCPSCGSEVVALQAASREQPPSPEEYRSEAYCCGWIDGRFGEVGCFTQNPNLTRWQEATERLEYYRGHRAGSEAHNAAMSTVGRSRSARDSLAAEEVGEMGWRTNRTTSRTRTEPKAGGPTEFGNEKADRPARKEETRGVEPWTPAEGYARPHTILSRKEMLSKRRLVHREGRLSLEGDAGGADQSDQTEEG